MSRNREVHSPEQWTANWTNKLQHILDYDKIESRRNTHYGILYH